MTRIRPTDLRGFNRLAIDATVGLTDLVEAMHHNIARAPCILGRPTQRPTTGITGLVYRSIRMVTSLVGGGIDAILAQLIPMLGDGSSSLGREAVLAALNAGSPVDCALHDAFGKATTMARRWPATWDTHHSICTITVGSISPPTGANLPI